MKNINFPLLTCVGWIALLVGECVGSIGQMSPCTKYSLGLPFMMLMVTGVPAVFGFLAGRVSVSATPEHD